MKTWEFIKDNLQTIITLGSIIGAVIMWFMTMSDIPKRVENIEHSHTIDMENLNTKFNNIDGRFESVDVRLRMAEVNIEKNATKADLTLQGIYEIRSILLKK